jgi:hypothetical protein
MLRKLMKALKRDKDVKWEKIGEITPVGSKLEKVPGWVVNEYQKIPWEKLKDASYNGYGFIVKGRTFEYLIEPHGQGPEYCYFYRRLKQGGKKQL